MQQVTSSTSNLTITNAKTNLKVSPEKLHFVSRPVSIETFATWLILWYENLSGVVSCPENSNINTDGLDSVVIGSRDR